MSVLYRSSSSGGVNGTALVINAPAGVVDGDVLIAGIMGRASNTMTCTPPAGWTQVLIQDRGTGGRLFVYRKVASSEGASYTFTLSATGVQVGGITAFSGANTTTPVNVSGSAGSGTSSLSHTAPSVTTTVDGCRILRIVGLATTNAASYTWPTSTERYDFSFTDVSSSVTSGATANQPAAGATGAETATASVSSQWAAATIAVAPATAPVDSVAQGVAPVVGSTLGGVGKAVQGGAPAVGFVLTESSGPIFTPFEVTLNGDFPVAVAAAITATVDGDFAILQPPAFTAIIDSDFPIVEKRGVAPYGHRHRHRTIRA